MENVVAMTEQENKLLAEERERDEQWARAHVVDREHGWTVADMRAAFSEIADTNDWRAPIDAAVRRDRLELMQKAVEFMTATELQVVGGYGNGWLHVKATGYRQGPAGDH